MILTRLLKCKEELLRKLSKERFSRRDGRREGRGTRGTLRSVTLLVWTPSKEVCDVEREEREPDLADI